MRAVVMGRQRRLKAIRQTLADADMRAMRCIIVIFGVRKVVQPREKFQHVPAGTEAAVTAQCEPLRMLIDRFPTRVEKCKQIGSWRTTTRALVLDADVRA